MIPRTPYVACATEPGGQMQTSGALRASIAIIAAIIVTAMSACIVDASKAVSDMTAPSTAAHPFDIRMTSVKTNGGALMFDVGVAEIDSVTSSVGTAFMIDGVGASSITARVVYKGQWQDGV